MKSKTKNPQTLAEEYDGIIDLIDEEKPIEANKINLRDVSEDPQIPNYAINRESGLAYGSDVKGDPSPIVLEENQSYCHEISINEAELRQSKHMAKVAKTDDVARGAKQ